MFVPLYLDKTSLWIKTSSTYLSVCLNGNSPPFQVVIPPPTASGAAERCRAMLQCNTRHCLACCFCGSYNVTAQWTETQLKKSQRPWWADLRSGKCVFILLRDPFLCPSGPLIGLQSVVADWLYRIEFMWIIGSGGSLSCVCVCAGLEWVSMRLLLLLLWAGSPLLCLGSRTKSHLLLKLDTPGAVYDGKNRNVILMLLGTFFTKMLPAFLYIQKTTRSQQNKFRGIARCLSYFYHL